MKPLFVAIHFPLNNPPRVLTWDSHPHLDDLQDLVGGYIEVCHLPHLKPYTFLIDEEGLLKENPVHNPDASTVAGVPIVGSALLLLFPLE